MKCVNESEDGEKTQGMKKPIDTHLRVNWSIKYDCTGIILKNFCFDLYKEHLILIQCWKVFMEDIPGISAIEKAL